MVYDAGVAREIEKRYGRNAKGNDGGEVNVAEIDYEDPTHERGHKYTFTSIGVPWGKYDELGRRLPDDPKPDRKKKEVKNDEQSGSSTEENKE